MGNKNKKAKISLWVRKDIWFDPKDEMGFAFLKAMVFCIN